MIEGPSGILAVCAGRPAALRGDAAAAGVDERRGGADVLVGGPGKPARAAVRCRLVRRARQMEERRGVWDMLQFGLRLGERPRAAGHDDAAADAADEAADGRSVGGDATRLRRRTNAENLAPGFSRRWQARYGGTRLGRQELDGELIEDRDDALWSREMLDGGAGRRSAASSAGSWWRSTRRRARERPRTRAASWRRGWMRERQRGGAGGRDGAGGKAAGLGGRGGGALPPAGGRLPRRRGEPGRRHGDGGDPHGRSDGAGQGGAGATAANGCAPSRWRRSTARAG